MSHLIPEPLWQTAQGPSDQIDTHSAPPAEIVLQVNGKAVAAKHSDTVATALLRAGHSSFAISVKTGKPISPTCLMGVCFGCVCTVDGRPGTQACLEPVRDGLVITIEIADQ